MLSGDPPLATLHELNTVYGLSDLHKMLEVMAVGAHNRRRAAEWARRRAQRGG